MVVDVFIPNRKSKVGKGFAFVRFIKVDNVDKLVGNLCTIWIGRFHLHANVARFERPLANSSRPPFKTTRVVHGASSFVSAVKGVSVPSSQFNSLPAMVLDDSCLVSRELDNFVMGEVCKFSSINNLYILLSGEGFHNIQLVYLGGLWVMMKLESAKAKDKLLKHVGVASWFNSLRSAQPDFVANERIVWVDIEGSDNILESIKIIVTRKVFKVRVKELFVWSPSLKDTLMGEFCSDDEFVKGNDENNVEASITNNAKDESDIEAVSDTYFGDNLDEQEHEKGQDQPAKDNDKETSPDPFNIYDLMDKHEKEVTKIDTALFGTWIPKKIKLLIIYVYAPQPFASKRLLWNFISSLILRWDGESIVMGDFNEVRCKEERWGSTFYAQGANSFNSFISSSGLNDIQLEGYCNTPLRKEDVMS
nr:hypothetical protein [Tanacetum cinerariifolium]